MSAVRFGRHGFLFLFVLCALAQGGCITRWFGVGSEPSVEGTKGSITLTKLERLVDTFAERQVTLIADACEAVKRSSPDPDARRRAHHMKLANATAVYDIVTQPELLGRLADLYLLVELQYLVWVDEGRAMRQFGVQAGNRIVVAAEEARHGMIRLAELAMKPERRQRFDSLIRRWRERNPDVEFISGIRFGALPEGPEKSFLESTSSFFDVINPMDDTRTSVERARLLAERAFFFSKRILKLADWQAEAALEETLAKPEIRDVLSDLDRAVASAEQLSRTVREMPDYVAKEREAILAAWDARSNDVLGHVREIRATIAEARDLAAQAAEAGRAFEQTFRALHEVVGTSARDPAAPPAHPFDIREYTAAVAELRGAAREGTGLVDAGKSLVDSLFARLVALLALFFVLLLGYRLVVTRWIRPPNRPVRNTEIRRPPTTWETRYGSPT